MKTISADKVEYSKLNSVIKNLYYKQKVERFLLKGVNGQSYIGSGIKGNVEVTIQGTPGNDLAAFSDGVNITVHGNAQDAIGNTMNQGKIVVHGSSGDAVGYSMRGGKIFIKHGTGYRVGIHMKQYKDKIPAIIIGNRAGDFLGEYMAGGIIILLGLNTKNPDQILGNYCGTGMHGGCMYIRGGVASYKLSREVKAEPVNQRDMETLKKYLQEFCEDMSIKLKDVFSKPFVKIIPNDKRPYGNLYAY